MLLQGKRAMITGASRGIGKAIAMEFAREGADIILHYYENSKDTTITLKDEAESVAADIRALGRDVHLIGFDIGDRDDIDAKIKTMLKEVTPDVLVNNAGITKDNLVMRMKPEQWDDVINVNLSGSFFLTKALVRPMLRSAGSIIFVASVIGQMGNAGQVNYAASKAGVIGMAKSLARELGSKKVRCNAIAPGFIETEMTAAMAPEAKARLLELVPLKEAGTPDDIAKAALFLASDMSRYITGEVLKVNGGMYM
ncbi:3-oxoacyl-[acyl-carrier-protein] reductase [bacterium]|nr:3-oxoacyl-[acyl-carrier-protein] reductase [bacterium]